VEEDDDGDDDDDDDDNDDDDTPTVDVKAIDEKWLTPFVASHGFTLFHKGQNGFVWT